MILDDRERRNALLQKKTRFKRLLEVYSILRVLFISTIYVGGE